MSSVSEIFGSKVFGDSVMRARLPKETYKALRRTIEQGKKLDPAIANIVANAMKDWAVENGATHFTHWPRRAGCVELPVRRHPRHV